MRNRKKICPTISVRNERVTPKCIYLFAIHFRLDQDKSSGYWRTGYDVSNWDIPDEPEEEFEKLQSEFKAPSW